MTKVDAATLAVRRAKRRIQREKVRGVWCPTCGAAYGEFCLRGGEPSVSNHAARHASALAMGRIVKRDWWE